MFQQTELLMRIQALEENITELNERLLKLEKESNLVNQIRELVREENITTSQ